MAKKLMVLLLEFCVSAIEWLSYCILMVFIATFISVFVGLIVNTGLENMIGKFLALVAVQTNNYDFNGLLAGFAVANIWLIGMVLTLPVYKKMLDDTETDKDESDK